MRPAPIHTLAHLLCVAAIDAATGDSVRINEVLANPLGTDIGQEFIELRGPAGLSLEDLALLVLEGDSEPGAATHKGRIDSVIPLAGHSLGANGLLLLRDGAGVIDTDPDPDQFAGSSEETAVVVLPSTSSLSGFGNGPLGLENGSISLLLVRGFSGAAGADLDANDDGILDSAPWLEVLDAVSIVNSSSGSLASSSAYAPSAGFPAAVISRAASGFDAGVIARGSDGSWFGAPAIGMNPTIVNPVSQNSGPYFWEPGRIYPAVGGVEYLASPGRENGAIPNTDTTCGSRLVTAQLGTVSFHNSWGFPTLPLAGSPVTLEGSSVAQKVGAARQVVFTARASGVHRFSLCASAVANTVMVASTACGDPSTAFAANNDSAGCGSNGLRSAFDLTLSANQTIYLAVGSYMATADPFPLGVGRLSLQVIRDSDGDGTFDEDDGCPDSPDMTVPIGYFVDSDRDGFGGPDVSQVCAMSPPLGYSTIGGDCDDSSSAAFPEAPELCATLGTDNDCDSDVDDVDADASDAVTYYLDADRDGYGDSYATARFCATAAPPSHSAQGGDCDDSSPDTYPGATEICDDRDNDCNQLADDGLPRYPYYPDIDRDGYGTGTAELICSDIPPEGYATADGDNCPDVYNPAQADCDSDGVGDACETPSLRLTTAAGVVEPDSYFYVDLSQSRFDERILSGSFRVAYDPELVGYLSIDSTLHYTATPVSDTVADGMGEIEFTVTATGSVATSPQVMMARILCVAVGGLRCERQSVMSFAGGGAANHVSGANGPLSGFSLSEQALLAFDATSPTLSGVPEPVLAFAGAASSVAVPPYAAADVRATDACGIDGELPVELRVTLPGGAELDRMPAHFPVGLTVVQWQAVDPAGNVARDFRNVRVQPGSPPACAANIASGGDSEGVVDGEDLATLLASWGRSGLPADIDGNGDVDGVDLTYLLVAWGPCR